MYYRVLVVHPKLRAEVVGEGLEARCLLGVGEDGQEGEEDGERVDVPLEVAALLWLADGVRTIEAIHEIAAEGGATLSLERVERALRRLQDVGLVAFQSLDEVAHRLLPGTVAHVCEGCGRSCEGHLVGPLPPSEVATIQGVLSQLQAKEPTLVGQAPFMSVAQNPGGVYLRLVEGRCIFLDGERRCMIHKHIGPEFKPSICRMFPYARVLTEEGYRFAIAPGCFRHHKQPQTTQEDAPQEMWADVTRQFGAADVTLTRLAPPTPDETRRDDLLVVWLGEQGRGLGELVGELVGEFVLGQEAKGHIDHISPQTVRMCGALGMRLLPALRGSRSFIGSMTKYSGPFAQSLRDLIAAIEHAGGEDVLDAPIPLPPHTERWMLDALRRSLFIRDALSFPDTQQAVAALVAGWVIALHQAARTHTDHNALHNAACELWAAWYRVIPHSGLGPTLFQDRSEAEALLRSLL